MGKPLSPPLAERPNRFSERVIDVQKIKYCFHSPNCVLCGDKRLLIIERLIDGEYSDETLSKIITILIAKDF
jgi:hypothetical protein